MLLTTERIPFDHMPRGSGVYRLVNTATGESYVGGSWYMRNRACQHASQLRLGTHPNRLLLNSYRTHGISAFVFEVVEKVRPRDVERREWKWIRSLQPAFNRIGRERFDASVHTPVQRKWKRRLIETAGRCPSNPSPAKLARLLCQWALPQLIERLNKGKSVDDMLAGEEEMAAVVAAD